jgi:hypothetical protein
MGRREEDKSGRWEEEEDRAMGRGEGRQVIVFHVGESNFARLGVLRARGRREKTRDGSRRRRKHRDSNPHRARIYPPATPLDTNLE